MCPAGLPEDHCLLMQVQILRVFKPSAEMCLSLRNVVVNNSWQHCAVSCVKLSTSCLTETTGHTYRDSALLSLPRNPWLIFFLFVFHKVSANDQTLNTKCTPVSICLYIDARTEALLFL